MSDDPNRVLVEPLSQGLVRTAFPLIQSVDATISLSEWLRYARVAVGGAPSRHGVLLARRSRQRHPCGAVCWRAERQVRQGAMLVAEHFAALDLIDPGLVLSTLMEALDDTAAALGCTAIRAMVPVKDGVIAAALTSFEYRAENTTFARRVEVRASP